MAETMRLLRMAMISIGYKCPRYNRKNMSSYFVTHARNGGIKFGIGIHNDSICIMRFSHIDPKNGTRMIMSSETNAEAIAVVIELLAHCAMLRAA